MKFNKEKFIAVLSYIVSRCENKSNVGKTVICKLLYFSDFNFYELYEKAITNETYIKFERGPFPDHFKSITDEMINKGDLIISKQPYHGDTTIHKYYLSKTPDLSLISTKELSVINDVIDKHADKTILIVTHSGPYRALRYLLNKETLKGPLLDGRIENCQYEEFDFE